MQVYAPYRAALCIVFAELFLVCSGMVVKQISPDVSTALIVFFRNLFGLFLMLPWLLRQGLPAIHTSTLHLHLLRALVGVTAMLCLYYSWGHLPLAEAALIKQTAPFFMPLFAFWWLGERVRPLVLVAVLVGFVGVFLILNPTDGRLDQAVLIALVGAMLGALAKIVIRRMSVSEPPQRIVFYFALFSTFFSAIPAWWVWQTPGLSEWGWLILMAATSTLAQLLLSRGYGLAPAGQLGPYTYASVAFAAFFGWLLWDEVLGWLTLSGIVLVVVAGLLTLTVQSKN
ncbi:DMT family transporter [Neptuniibacter sp. CAU 1671]|uniref:DMT family transporter n=1 Tax=Neptuniibacter sp. CAU 1671 TaxID=3032593 RepID=UPI0023D985A0|nr:DMT family transporter [Neptuniibacter sp. CAU 1671]MDF2180677.1 DMT family transporter [Neptuniibacter sp. CAU 1671]